MFNVMQFTEERETMLCGFYVLNISLHISQLKSGCSRQHGKDNTRIEQQALKRQYCPKLT